MIHGFGVSAKTDHALTNPARPAGAAELEAALNRISDRETAG